MKTALFALRIGFDTDASISRLSPDLIAAGNGQPSGNARLLEIHVQPMFGTKCG